MLVSRLALQRLVGERDLCIGARALADVTYPATLVPNQVTLAPI